jgi:hypothetical protein
VPLAVSPYFVQQWTRSTKMPLEAFAEIASTYPVFELIAE